MRFTIRDLIWLTIVVAFATMYGVEGYQARRREVRLRAGLQAMKDFREIVDHKDWIEIKASSQSTGPATYSIQVDVP